MVCSLRQDFASKESFAVSRHVRLFLPLMGVFAIALILRFVSILHHDVSWFLYETEQYVRGAVLYVDIVELNPPLFIWIMSPSVMFAKFAGVSSAVIYRLFVFAVAALSVSLCAKFIDPKRRNRNVLLIILAAMFVIFPGFDFGKRVHLMLLFCMPYVFLIGARVQQRSINFSLILLASILATSGFLLKPHFLLIPVTLEIYLMYKVGLRRMFFRAEPFIFGACACIYLTLTLVFTPNYFSQIARYAIEVYSVGYNSSFIAVAQNIVFVFPAILAVIIWMKLHKPWKSDPYIVIFLIIVLDGLVIYFVQSKGWHYQALPLCFALTILVSLLLLSQKGIDKLNRKSTYARLFMVVTSIFVASEHVANWKYPTDLSDKFLAEIEHYPETDSVMVMASQFSHIHPFIYRAKVINASRLSNFWLTPGILRKRKMLGHSTPLLDEIETFNRDIVTEDILRHKPQIVFVDVSDNKRYFGDLKFDYITDFSINPQFEAAWREYNIVKKVDGFEVYHLNAIK